MTSSEFSGFYKLSVEERRKRIREFSGLSEEDMALLEESNSFASGNIAKMVENSIGTIPIPLGVAVNFKINGTDYIIPMAIEEPSVIAAASNAAKIIGECGGFTTHSTEPVMIGQIQLLDVEKPEAAVNEIIKNKNEFIEIANKQDEILINRGGGIRDIEARVLETESGKMVIIHLLVDVRDAMGANVINTMAEAISPKIEELTGGKTCLKIISNLATRRLARANVVLKQDVVGEEVIDGIICAYSFAVADNYRCATHNKGIMNGIDAVVIATGNDWRAVEAGAHSYAAMGGRGYGPLTTWKKDDKGNLVGSIELPMAVGIVGGAIRSHPMAKLAIKILGVKSARELAEILAAVGLAQNFAALRALSTVGIQKGHMKLHARNIAILAGAHDDEVDPVLKRLKMEDRITVDKAREILKTVRGNR
ncbi:MAG: hydroxymethylglutaryl-CoA reductase, degradative [Candidatus Micrarchaeota archaeon]